MTAISVRCRLPLLSVLAVLALLAAAFGLARPARAQAPLIDLLFAEQWTMPPKTLDSMSFKCRTGRQVVGGGFASAEPPLYVTGNFPYETSNGWLLSQTNTGGSPRSLDYYATCLLASPGDVSVVESVYVTVATGQAAQASASCPGGTKPAGGGYLTHQPSSPLDVLQNRPLPASNGWTVRMANAAVADNQFKAYAACVATRGFAVRVASSRGVTVPPRGAAQAVAVCPAGTEVAGGGFFGAAKVHVTAAHPLPRTRSWRVGASNEGPVARTLTAYATCVSHG